MKREITEAKNDHIKRSIIKTRNVIRKKFRDLHSNKLSLNEDVREIYKPIIEPLETLAKNKDIKQEKSDDSPNVKEPKIEKKEKPEEKYVYMPDSVFKTAVAPYKSNPFQYNSSRSVSNNHEVSGVYPLEDDLDVSNIHEEYIKKQAQQTDSPKIDSTYGFRYKNGDLRLGNQVVYTREDDNGDLVYSIKQKNFPVTHGLTDLLLMNDPRRYTDQDLKTYKNMLLLTNAHKKNYVKSNDVVRDKSQPKYIKIISQLFPEGKKSVRRSMTKTGECLKKPQTNFKKFVNKKGYDYVYWDDPNELVDRLRLLISSQIAGHTGHDNEIISIIEELRESKIIK